MLTVKRIDIGSAFRIGALVTGIVSLIITIPFLLCWLSVVPAMTFTDFDGRSTATQMPAFFQGASIITLALFYVCGSLIYAVIGGIMSAIYAFIYNLVSKQFGGLQVEVDGLEAALPAQTSKGKNSFYDTDFEQS